MLNELKPAIYQELRQRANLTQGEMAALFKIHRATVINIEAGRADLDTEQERRLIALAQVSKQELAEMLCEQISEIVGRPVGLSEGSGTYEPTTALARASVLLRDHAHRISPALTRALHNRINTTQLIGLAFERNNADLVELTQDCMEAMRSHPRGAA